MTRAITVYAALGPSRVAEQVYRAFDDDPRFEIVGRSDDTGIVISDLKCFEEPTDVVLCDVEIADDPKALITRLARRFGTRVVALGMREELAEQVDAMLEHGAVHCDALAVDASGQTTERRLERLVHLVSLIAQVRNIHSPPATTGGEPQDVSKMRPGMKRDRTPSRSREPSFASDPAARRRNGALHRFLMIGIVSSTGGLNALETVLAKLPQDFPVPIAVTQHLGVGSEGEFVRILDGKIELSVRVVRGTMRPKTGTVYIGPPGKHLVVNSSGRLTLSAEPHDVAHKPSASVLLASMARVFGSRCVGVVLTGMGADGAEGLLEIRRKGGRTLVQDRSSSSIFGMPQAAIDLAAAERVLPLTEIAPELSRLAQLRDSDDA